jgi:hypothetical protein
MAKSLSLYEAMMQEFDGLVTLAGFYNERPGFLRELAVKELQTEGVEVVGSPTLVEHVVAERSTKVLAELHEVDEHFRRRRPRGRPRNSYPHNVVLMAASCAVREPGVSKRKVRTAAAERLGGGITAEQVSKAEKAYVRDWNHLNRVFGGRLDGDTAAQWILDMEAELDRIENNLREQGHRKEAERKARRYSPSVASCFGASTSSTLNGSDS